MWWSKSLAGLAFLIMRDRLSAAAFGVCCGVISAINARVAGVDALLAGFMVDNFGYRSIFVLTLMVGIVAPRSLPGIANASYGIGGSLGFTWAGTVVGAGSHTSYQSGLWVCVGIGIVAVAASLILKPRAAASPAGRR
jgi:hypothetical protein